MKRKARGQDLPPEVGDDRVVLGYRGLDGVVRRTVLQFEPRPPALTADTARFDLSLAAAARRPSVRPRRVRLRAVRTVGPRSSRFDEARAEAEAALERHSAWSCHVRTSERPVQRLGSTGPCPTCT